ncbi:GAF domain-containing protein [Idiomarina sp. A28L]|uniref:FHA domain-containing protein n=1 Tax=Idiomarina sp. A28L TaxID=1036674 RepID=UPI00021389AB|nr:FHA domain-containing protein [Idiomarina sp. A28L]EGN74977.1 GAF domain-containing protein [Idiomarina sp. A28L]
MPLRLQMNLVDQPSQISLLLEGRHYVIGRGSKADIRINDPAISRAHAQIQFREGSWQIQDLNSRSGCYFAHERIEYLSLPYEPLRFRMGHVNCLAEQLPYRDAVAADSEAGWQFKQIKNSTLRLAQTMNLETFANFATETLQNLFPRERAALLLLNEAGVVIQSCGNPSWCSAADFSGSRSAIRRAVTENQPVVLANINDDPLLRNAHSIVEQELSSLICVPVNFNGRTYAVLYADSTETSRAFTDIDLRVVTSYARQLGIVFGLREIDQELANSELPL